MYLRIHCDAGDGKFLIVKTNMEDLYFYRVYLESQFDEKGRYKQLGTCIDSDDVIKIIRYYLKTGEFYGHK